MRCGLILLIFLSSLAFGAPQSDCRTIRLSDIGWSDVSATTAVASELLKASGYEPHVTLLSLPVTLASLANGDIDAFLGNWMPTQTADIGPYISNKKIEVLTKNLAGAHYTLAVPEYVYQAGVHQFSDLSRYEREFSSQIFGIEAGNDGNTQISKLLRDPKFNLKNWRLVESSEQGMLTQVGQATTRKEWIVFLGWSPHPMNLHIPMRYLSGGDTYFGKNSGSANVYTLTRQGLASTCPEAAALLRRIKFSIQDENELMELILNQKLSPEKAAQKWLGKHPQKVVDYLGSQELASKYLFGINNFSEGSFHFQPVPIGSFAEDLVGFLTKRFSKQFLSFSHHVESIIQTAIHQILRVPALLMILCVSGLLYAWRKSLKLAFGVCLGLLLILNMGLWIETIQTLVLVTLASGLSCLVGIPLGIYAARSQRFYSGMKPVLDLMQTLPTFVYLIPTLMLFGLGIVPGLVSTFIFAVAAPIRLTHLGLSQVPVELLEVAEAFGASKWQRFLKVELPHAMPSIMAGLNQCILLSLSMVVIAALVGADGLGTPVVRALNTVNLKQGFEAGLAIVILALILDRSLQAKRSDL